MSRLQGQPLTNNFSTLKNYHPMTYHPFILDKNHYLQTSTLEAETEPPISVGGTISPSRLIEIENCLYHEYHFQRSREPRSRET